MKNKVIAALLFALALVSMGAIQRIVITEYTTKSGAICFGDPQPFACAFPPTTPAIGTPFPPLSTPTPTRAPAPTSTPIPPLLLNADFEQANHAGWTVFHLWENRTEPNDERGHPESRFDGAQSLRFFNENRCWLSGVYQSVSVTQLATYTAWAHGRTWASYTSVFPSPSELSVTDGVAVGVDPNGGVDPLSTAIIWTEASNTENWQLIQMRFTALSNKATVFVRARLGAIPPGACNWPLPFMVAFIDGAGIRLEP